MNPTVSSPIEPTSLHTDPPGPDGLPSLSVHQPPVGSTTTTTLPTSGSSITKPTQSTEPKSSATGPTATGLRQRVNNLGTRLDAATEHPAVQNAKGQAQRQIGQLRETLARSSVIVDLEKRTGVDRVLLVLGGIFTYILLIPLNLFGLALPTTTLLTLLPPSFLALGLLERAQSEQNDAAVRALLSYFVVLGFIQFAESLAAGVLEKRVPHFYTIKLLFLAYLIHPRTQGAMKIHQSVLRPLLVGRRPSTPMTTPAQTKDDGSSVSSPTFSGNAASPPTGSVHLPSGSGTGVGLDVPK